MAVTVKTDKYASGSGEEQIVIDIGTTGDEEINYIAQLRVRKDYLEAQSAAVKAALQGILFAELFNAPYGNDSDASNNTETIS